MKKVGGLVAATALSMGALVATASPASADVLLVLCVTVTDKSVSVQIGGEELLVGPVGVNRTCIVI